MGVFDSFSAFLKSAVGNNLHNDPQDVKNTKFHLNQLGFHEGESENGYITKALDSGIRKFQRAKGLKVDGVMHPGGETERSLYESLTGRSADHVFGPLAQNSGGHVSFGGNVSGTLESAPVNPNALPYQSRIRNMSSADTNAAPQTQTPPIPRGKPETLAPTPKGDALLNFIGKLESSDNYNVIYGNEEKPLTKMTVKEVQQIQKDMQAKNMPSTAVGRYQFRDTTLKETVDKLGIDKNALFNEKLQDRLARSRLEHRGFEKYQAGQISTGDFIRNLSQEWASIPEDQSNESYYKGRGNNKALTDFQTVKDMLEKK